MNISNFLFLRMVSLIVFCEVWCFSKFKKSLLDFSPKSYKSQRLLILIPVLISSYIVLSSCLQMSYSVLLFSKFAFCSKVLNLFSRLFLALEQVIVNLRTVYFKNLHFG